MPIFSTRNLCPNCGKMISHGDVECWACHTPFHAVRCVGCGSAIDRRSPTCQRCGEAAPPPPLPNAYVRRPRGGRIIALGAVSLLLLPLAGTMLSCAGYMSTGGFLKALPYLVCGVGAIVFGQSFGTVGLVFAFRDWVGMKAGRMAPNGWGRTVFGGSLAAVSLLLYWWAIGAVIFSLF